MKKILLTLALAFCCAAGQGQTTAKPADVNIQELNTKWAKFTQYAEQKQINYVSWWVKNACVCIRI